MKLRVQERGMHFVRDSSADWFERYEQCAGVRPFQECETDFLTSRTGSISPPS